MVYTDELPQHPHKQVTTAWYTSKNEYKYQLADTPRKSNVWNIMARIVDGIVDRLLLERLRATTIGGTAWKKAIEPRDSGDPSKARRTETPLRAAKTTKTNLIAA